MRRWDVARPTGTLAAMALHQDMVLAAQFNAAGTRLYSASVEGAVGVWDVRSGSLLHRWDGHRGPINAVTCRQDQIATGGHDRSIGIWSASDGRLIRRLRGHAAGVLDVALSERLVASASYDATIAVWDRASGERLAVLTGHDDAVTSVAFLDANRLISASRDCTLRLWDIQRGQCDGVLNGHHAWVTRVATLPDERAVSVGEDGLVILWHTNTVGADSVRESSAKSVVQSLGQPIWGLAADPAGRFAMVGAAGSAHLVDLVNRESRILPGYGEGLTPRAIAIVDSGEMAALGGDLGEVQLYDLAGECVSRTLPGVSKRILSAAADARGTLVTGNARGDIEFRKAGVVRSAELAHRFAYAARRLDERRAATGGFDSKVRIWEVETGECVAELDHGGFVFALSATADGRMLLSAGGNMLNVWDTIGADNVRRMQVASGTHTFAAISPAGDRIVSVGEDRLLHLYSLADDSTGSFELSDDNASVVEFMPDGRRVVVGNAYGRVSLVDLECAQEKFLHAAHEDWIRTLRVSPHGRYVASASQNCVGRVYDLELEGLAFNEALAGRVLPAVEISPEGEILFVDYDGQPFIPA